MTTTTISREQAAYARERVAEAGLAERVEVIETDYRDLEGRYDKLASIEMIEAVGWQYFDAFFEACGRRLRPDGLMFLQAIVIDDRAYELEKASRSFANKHVFPGGCLPSQGLIVELTEKLTDMRPLWLEEISSHYALHAAPLARAIRGRLADPAIARLRRALPTLLALLPRHLRGGFSRAPDPRSSAAASEARLEGT